MLAKVFSSAVIGIDAYRIEVEVDVAPGLPVFTIVGLPEAAVKESKERVKRAIHNSGYPFPCDRITVNLAPADVKKEGTGFDLPIAVGILSATGIISPKVMAKYSISGELSLDGNIKRIKGTLPMTLAAKQTDCQGIVVPYGNKNEAAIVDGISVFPVRTLSEVVDFFRGFRTITPETRDVHGLFRAQPSWPLDYAEVTGQEHAKRALEIAAAGSHNLLMSGPPGSGKTMLAKRFPSILPPMVFDEAIETTMIYSVAGKLSENCPLVTQRPFRAPHHTISQAGLIGGGRIPRPGEVSLAHHGVLFLDELPEFNRSVLEVLRQPVESQTVTLSRATTTLTFPASFMLLAAMNPCPCGYYGDPVHECTCSENQRRKYLAKLSGPLLDRIDLHVEVPALNSRELMEKTTAEPSAAIRRRVLAARALQSDRFSRSALHCNAQMNSRQIRTYCRIDTDSSALLSSAIDRLGLSARAYNRILKISRTIADLEGKASIGSHHIAEAIQYRDIDRNRPPLRASSVFAVEPP